MNDSLLYSSMLEKRLIDDFKKRFYEKLGYEPIVITEIRLDREYVVPLMSLSQLKNFMEPFSPVSNGMRTPMFSKSRKRDVVELRMIFCYIARQMRYTCDNIGHFMNGRDHTTVLHSVNMFKNLLETSDVFREKYTRIVAYIKKNYESSTMEEFDQVQLES